MWKFLKITYRVAVEFFTGTLLTILVCWLYIPGAQTRFQRRKQAGLVSGLRVMDLGVPQIGWGGANWVGGCIFHIGCLHNTDCGIVVLILGSRLLEKFPVRVNGKVHTLQSLGDGSCHSGADSPVTYRNAMPT